ncbi:exodeoxyribonuclease V subunit gamma [Gordonia sp. CPCC 205515]|uniref:exodeoxyribonuclease V subunit gamma n=1 Tax=Gordonia sp. CPCC 205515 TaxID=3140791 RepID=UPI003AF3AAF0
MFRLHRAERTDTLADALGDIVVSPLDDPMRAEVVAVPAPGVERWLQQRLATRLGTSGVGDGICANIDFASPAALTDRVLADAHGAGDGHRLGDPWRPAAMVWPILEVLDDTIDRPGLSVLARHLGLDPKGSDTKGSDSEHRLGRRYAAAHHIAGLFDSYGRQRPTILVDWAADRDTDGIDAAVPADLAWQPMVWRAVRAIIGEPHPAELLADLCDRLRADPQLTDLPERLSVFGPTRVTESLRAVLAALAAHRDVHVFVPHASPALWTRLDDQPSAGSAPIRRTARPDAAIGHPLLAGLSRDVQELQLRLRPSIDRDEHHPPAAPSAPTLLSALQSGIRDDELGPGSVVADTSVEVHACHGPDRQVEILRDRLLHLFDADPTLQPRDVLIMCPDVDTFAPLIRGAFGQPGLGHPAFDLRVRLADRGLRHVNPILDVIAVVTELAAGRATAGEVVDLLGRDPVRTRFEMSDDDLDVVREWLSHSGIRWGLDDRQRASFGLGGFAQGTFDAGVGRIALGTLADERDGEWLDTALPLDGVESTDIDLAGRLIDFIDRLTAILADVAQPAPRAVWAERLAAIVDDLTAVGPSEAWQRGQALAAIGDAVGEPGEHRGTADTQVLRLGDVRDLLSALIAGRPTRANFRTGELTVCTMVPMRSVPHRVIILLGVDTDVFPRAQRSDGDDVLGRDPVIGERNPRDEDRQLFLDAVTAATENLLVFYTGADPITGTRVPPAVVVGELTDTLSVLTGGVDVVRRHTLHAFDAHNFESGVVPGISGPLSYDAELLSGAKALRSPTKVVTPRIAGVEVSAPPHGDIDLTDLTAFLVNPLQGFLRQRLGASIVEEDQRPDDHLDVTLEPLDRWAIGDRFLSEMLAGRDFDTCRAAEQRRGSLPPFEFGTRELDTITRDVRQLFLAADAERSGTPASRDIVVGLPDGRQIHGTVGDIFGSAIIAATYSRLKAKQRLTAWVHLLALAAAAPTEPAIVSSVVIGRGSGSRPVARSVLTAPDDPLAVLHDLVRLRDLGLRTPLPLPLDPAAEYARVCGNGARPGSGIAVARKAFSGPYGPAKTDSYLRLVYGGDTAAAVDFDDILTPTIGGAELGDLHLPGEPDDHLFCGLSRFIWEPLLTNEATS